MNIRIAKRGTNHDNKQHQKSSKLNILCLNLCVLQKNSIFSKRDDLFANYRHHPLQYFIVPKIEAGHEGKAGLVLLLTINVSVHLGTSPMSIVCLR